MLKSISRRASEVMDTSFLLTYLLKFVVFYYFFKYAFLAWHGASDETGTIYLSFCHQYFNFNVFSKLYMMQIPLYLADLFGVQAVQDSINSLQVEGGGRLLVKQGCYGLGLLSFWIAFVFADAMALQRKLIWSLAGVVILLLINSLRVTLLLIAKSRQWNIHLLDSYGLDHHAQFNIVAYLLIFLLMFIYFRRNRMQYANVEN